MTDVVLYTGKSLVSKEHEPPRAFMMHIEEEHVLVLLSEDGKLTGRIADCVSDAEREYLFALPEYTEIELIVRVKDGS